MEFRRREEWQQGEAGNRASLWEGGCIGDNREQSGFLPLRNQD